MAEHIYTYDDPPSERDLSKACQVLGDSGVIAYQTDLNWAFACDAASPKALARTRRLKPAKEQPFSLICSDIAMASSIVNVEHNAYRMLKKAWPGPYTILMTASKTLPKQIKDKRRVVGVRIPTNPMVRELVHMFGRPLASTSVPDLADGRPVQFGYQVDEQYGHALDLILDLGKEVNGLESTVIDFTQSFPELVRQGVGDLSLFDL